MRKFENHKLKNIKLKYSLNKFNLKNVTYRYEKQFAEINIVSKLTTNL